MSEFHDYQFFMLYVILDVGDWPARTWLLPWKELGREYGEWTWVGRFYE